MTSNLFVGSFAFCLHSFGVNWSLMYINNHLPRWTFRFNHDWENGLEFISEVTRSSCFTGYFFITTVFSFKLKVTPVPCWGLDKFGLVFGFSHGNIINWTSNVLRFIFHMDGELFETMDKAYSSNRNIGIFLSMSQTENEFEIFTKFFVN